MVQDVEVEERMVLNELEQADFGGTAGERTGEGDRGWTLWGQCFKALFFFKVFIYF